MEYSKGVAFRAGFEGITHEHLPFASHDLLLNFFATDLTAVGERELGKMLGQPVEVLISTLITKPEACREIESARQLKAELENRIAKLLTEFTQKTSLTIEGITPSLQSTSGDYSVNLSVNL